MVAQASNSRIHSLLDDIRKGTLVPNPSFQRRLVWSNKHKSAFIETVLRGYPFPEIYIAAGEVDLETGQGVQMLVDGQQRLTTLKQYFEGSPDLKLSKDVTPYAELTTTEKRDFLEYPVVVRDLGQISMKEIKDIFQRINSTNYALNPMEVHNARFDGELKKFAEELAQHPFFEDNRIFGAYEIRRMRDTTFTLSVIITVMSTYFNQESEFEGYLRRYNDEFEEKDDLKAEFQEVFQFIDKCGFTQNSRTLRQKSNLFTLLVEVHRALTQENENPLEPKEIGKRLQQFYALVEKSSKIDDTMGKERSRVLEYYDAIIQGTNHRGNRIKRGKIIEDVINGEFVFDRGAETHFSETEQRHIRYWTGLREYMVEKGSSVNCPSPGTGHYLDLRLGQTGFGIEMRLTNSRNEIGIWLYIQADNAEAHFRLLKEQREDIHMEMGRVLEWIELVGHKRKRIGLDKGDTDPLDENDWPHQYEWFATHLELFVKVFQKRIQELDAAVHVGDLLLTEITGGPSPVGVLPAGAVRRGSYPIAVTIPDRNLRISCRKGIDTLIKVIEELGIEKVRALGIMSHGIPLVAINNYGSEQKKVGEYYIAGNSSTDTKVEQIKVIAQYLNIELIPEQLNLL